MLKVKNLTKTYENGVQALRGVSFDTPNCGLIAITGSSGCGKSTLLNVLSGMDEKTDGDILFDGVLCNPKQVKSTFATIYQDYKLIENLSVFDNILVAKELTDSGFSIEEIDALLKKLRIFECKNEKVLSLSGGQKQRVAIARALVQKPKIIFADEPTGNLDSQNSENIFGLLKELSKEILILIVTHDVETISKYADRIIKLHDGKIIDDNIICEAKNANVGITKELSKKPSKKGLSFKTAMSVAIAFNKSKIGRRIAFVVISTLLLLVMTVCCNWAMIDYETMVTSTYNNRNASNMAISQYEKYQNEEIGNGNTNVQIYSDLTPFQEYLKNEKGINSAKVYDKYLTKSIFNMPDIFYRIQSSGVNGRITIQEHAYGSAGVHRFIGTNDIESLGIKMLEGRSPKTIGEVAIPKSKQIYFNALGGYYDNELDDYVIISPDELLGYDFFGVKIVGVFDDGVEVPDKFAKPIYDFGDESKEADSYVQNKVLSSSIIVSTAWSDLWDTALYMDGPEDAKISQGQYIHTSLIVDNKTYNNIGVAPANELTAHITGVLNVEKGNILVGKNFALLHKIKDGDIVSLSTDLVRGDVSTFGSGYVIDKNIQSMKKFKVKVDTSNSTDWEVLYNEEDYLMMMDNAKSQANKIIYNIDSLSTSELKQLNKKCQDIFGVSKIDNYNKSMLWFEIDDGRGLASKYFEMRMIGDYVMIAASIIIAFIVGVLLYNSISIIINSKANDLLILKSLGANKFDYLKIYGIFTIVQLLIELAIGIGCGIGGVLLLNTFITKVASFEVIVQLPLIPMAVFTTMLIAVVISILSLTINICRISDKNLRKAFQKTKE